jgi:hypothetical protein
MAKKILVALLIIALLAFTGCSKDESVPDVDATPKATHTANDVDIPAPASDNQYNVDELLDTETKYIVIDNVISLNVIGYLPEEDEIVQFAIKLANEFCETRYNNDYQTMTGDEEFDCYDDFYFTGYSTRIPADKIMQDCKDRIVQAYVDAKRITTFDSYTINQIYITSTKDTISIHGQATITVTDGEEPSTKRIVSIVISPQLIDGNWIIRYVDPSIKHTNLPGFFGDEA